MKVQVGEVVLLDDNKEYICFAKKEWNGDTYDYLVSNFKPLEVFFAKESFIENEIELDIVTDATEKETLLKLFQNIDK